MTGSECCPVSRTLQSIGRLASWALQGLLARQVAGGTVYSCIFRLDRRATHSTFSLCIFIYETNHTITCRHVLNMTLVSAK